MPSNRYGGHGDYALEAERRRRSRSRSRSRTRYDRDNDRRRRKRSYSRSRSRSLEERRHRRKYSRSRSRSRDYRDRRYSSRQSRSRSNSRSHSKSQRSGHASRGRSRSNSKSHDYEKHHHSRDHSHRAHESSEKRQKDEKHYEKTLSHHGNISSIPEDYEEGKYETKQDLDLPLPSENSKKSNKTEKSSGGGFKQSYYNFGEDEEIDKEKIHKEIEEKLRQALAKEGKVYPRPKPEASHPVFANDGSFLEIFKKMQQQQVNPIAATTSIPVVAPMPVTLQPALAPCIAPVAAPYAASTSVPLAPPPPLVGRRRGGKILKTGVVAKPKPQAEGGSDPKDFWSLYLAEVNKYKNTACESDGGTRPLVK